MIEASQIPKKKLNVSDVGAQQVAAVYAKAFVGAAESAGQTEAAVEELASVAAALAEYPKLEALLASALVDHDEKCEVLKRVFGPKVSPLVLNFLFVVSRHGRLDVLRTMDEQVRKLFDEHRGLVRVELQTAT